MIDTIEIYFSKTYDAYFNQAVESALFNLSKDGSLAVYFWQNDKTVFIGKNQNIFKEVNLQKLKEDGGVVARRFTGGGAVYHDKNNLNFSFITPKGDYDKMVMYGVIRDSLASLGIDTEISGRNDILANGCKFSGNAFYNNEKAVLHHGTILIDTDISAMQNYLTVSQCKLQTKGVDSVRSRVVNLKELNGEIDAEKIEKAIENSIEKTYNVKAVVKDISQLDKRAIEKEYARFTLNNWLYGKNETFDYKKTKRFGWGEVEIEYNLKGDIVTNFKLFTDSLDTEVAKIVEANFVGNSIANLVAEATEDKTKDILTLMI